MSLRSERVILCQLGYALDINLNAGICQCLDVFCAMSAKAVP